jgi:hypothetical protein
MEVEYLQIFWSKPLFPFHYLCHGFWLHCLISLLHFQLSVSRMSNLLTRLLMLTWRLQKCNGKTNRILFIKHPLEINLLSPTYTPLTVVSHAHKTTCINHCYRYAQIPDVSLNGDHGCCDRRCTQHAKFILGQNYEWYYTKRNLFHMFHRIKWLDNFAKVVTLELLGKIFPCAIFPDVVTIFLSANDRSFPGFWVTSTWGTCSLYCLFIVASCRTMNKSLSSIFLLTLLQIFPFWEVSVIRLFSVNKFKLNWILSLVQKLPAI